MFWFILIILTSLPIYEVTQFTDAFTVLEGIFITLIATSIILVVAIYSVISSIKEEFNIENNGNEISLFGKDEFDSSKVDMKFGIITYNISDSDYIELKLYHNIIFNKRKQIILEKEKKLVNKKVTFSIKNPWTFLVVTGDEKYEYTIVSIVP